MTAPVRVSRRPIVLGDLVATDALRGALLVVAAAGLVGLVAQVSIPVPGSPVPITGQTFGVLLTGAALGWRRSLASMLLYMVAGMVGMPWFASHAHGFHMPSFGYILGFLVAGPVVGALARRGADRSPLRTVGAFAVGTFIVYAIGVPYLAADLHLSASQAIHAGLRPFLIGDALKAALAAGLLPGAWALVDWRGRA